MNLTEPLDGLTSPVEAAVLRVLAKSDAGFSGRQLHVLAGVGSTSSVHRALAAFVHLGLVLPESRPPAIIYRANRDHVLWPVVDLALGARERALDSIVQFCLANAPADLTVLLFGSVARRESTLDSDIDLFVVFPDSIDDELEAEFTYRLADHVEHVTGSEAQVLHLRRAELAKRLDDDDPLVVNVIEDGHLLHGAPLISQQARLSA
jgi:predicted nucleotidyltransferase